MVWWLVWVVRGMGVMVSSSSDVPATPHHSRRSPCSVMARWYVFNFVVLIHFIALFMYVYMYCVRAFKK